MDVARRGGGAGDAFELAFWEPGDRATALRLLAAASSVDGRPNLGPEWFEWKMAGSPWGPAVVAFATDRATGAIAGEVAFGTWRFWHQGAEVPSALSYETYVVPAYQRRGLFSRLTVAALEELRRRGIGLIVNFPNANSLPGFLKLDFQDLGGFETWLRPHGIAAAARLGWRLLRGPRSPVAAPTRELSVRDEWITAAAALAANARRFPVPWAAVRTRALLSWRYATIPTYSYATGQASEVALLGRVETISELRVCRVLEAISSWTPGRRAFGVALEQLQASSRADVTMVQLTRAHPLRRWLPTMGFVPAPDHISVCARRLDAAAPLAACAQWIMTPGDFHTT